MEEEGWKVEGNERERWNGKWREREGGKKANSLGLEMINFGWQNRNGKRKNEK